MSRHVSFPKPAKRNWTKLSDANLVAYFDGMLEVRTGLTCIEWDAYNAARKRLDPIGFENERKASYKRIDMRNAKERLTIAELEEIIAEKRIEESHSQETVMTGTNGGTV